MTLQERKQLKEEKKLKAAEEKSIRAKGSSPAPIRIKISLKGKGKNGSGPNSRVQSDSESVDSEGPSLASKAESEVSDPASDAEVGPERGDSTRTITNHNTYTILTQFNTYTILSSLI